MLDTHWPVPSIRFDDLPGFGPSFQTMNGSISYGGTGRHGPLHRLNQEQAPTVAP